MRINCLKIKSLAVGLALMFAATGCGDHRTAPDPATLPDQIVYALNSANQLLQLNIRNSNAPTATTTITGVDTQGGERIVSIDFRPATGQLYGVSNQSRIFVINTATAVARAIGTAAFSPAISGDVVSIDFNPTVDRIRLVTNTGLNLRLNPETGAAVTPADGNINGVAGATVAGVAYTNNRAGATTTTLYDIDPATDRLYIQNPPNNGTLVDVGPLGLNITGAAGFDIAFNDNTQGLVAVTFNGASELQQINLSTGRLQKLGNLPGAIIGLAIPTEPVAYAIDGGTNNLLIFNPLNPIVTTKTITGLQPGETILGIDTRPLNGQLFILGSSSRLYLVGVNATTAWTLTQIGMTGSFMLSGTDFGFDFNPTVDRIRVVSNTGQNLRLNPTVMPTESALAATDGTLTFAPSTGTPNVSASAYTNNFAGAGTTVLYDIDVRSGGAVLFQQNPPNNGVLVNVGPLNVDIDGVNGFDIGGTSGTAYALLRPGGVTRVFTISLSSGAATAGAAIPGNPAPRGFTLGLGF